MAGGVAPPAASHLPRTTPPRQRNRTLAIGVHLREDDRTYASGTARSDARCLTRRKGGSNMAYMVTGRCHAPLLPSPLLSLSPRHSTKTIPSARPETSCLVRLGCHGGCQTGRLSGTAGILHVHKGKPRAVLAAGAMARHWRCPTMATIPKIDCDCWRFTTPLLDTEELPDHICTESAIASVWKHPRPQLQLPTDPVWPVSTPDGDLGLVIRQWAQEEPSETFANQLPDFPAWQREVNSARVIFEYWRKKRPANDVATWVAHTGSDQVFARGLRKALIPDSPATLAHLRAVAAGLDKPFPARGIFVTTLVYVSLPRNPYGGPPIVQVHHHESLMRVPELTTGPIYDLAWKTLKMHKEWVNRHEEHPLGSIHNKRRAQPHSFSRQTEPSDERFDYLAVALSMADIATLRHSQLDRESAISKHLRTTQNIVLWRRKRAHLPTTPPRGWQKEARQRLHALLEQSQ